MKKSVRILGTRGVPANYGGFETFAENLSLYLAPRGWDVTVYCHESARSKTIYESHWCGVRRVHIPVNSGGPAGTVEFDWKSTLHACREPGLVLTLGYNTAIFCAWYRLRGLKNIINMDGIEWRRQKWGRLARMWLYLNERAGVWMSNHVIADHPEIERHLSTRVRRDKITTITYGAPKVDHADPFPLARYGVTTRCYAIVVARPEPENSVLQIVRAWSRRPRGLRLLVLGDYSSAKPYHRAVMDAASDEVVFPGAVYDAYVLSALRYFARLYIHGHQVGGTNPSLVEALGAGNAVLAHDNAFNRWVAGEGALYFSCEDSCAEVLDDILDDAIKLRRAQEWSIARHGACFTWEQVLAKYDSLLLAHLGASKVPAFEAVTERRSRMRP